MQPVVPAAGNNKDHLYSPFLLRMICVGRFDESVDNLSQNFVKSVHLVRLISTVAELGQIPGKEV